MAKENGKEVLWFSSLNKCFEFSTSLQNIYSIYNIIYTIYIYNTYNTV